MLGLEAMRFIRTKWKGPQPLAEELYAIFRKGLKIQPGQVTIEQTGDEPAIVINRSSDASGPAIQIVGGTGDAIEFGGTTFGDLDFGGIDFTYGDSDTSGSSGGSTGGSGSSGGSSGSSGGTTSGVPTDVPVVLYGEVQAQVSGATYTVKVWTKNPATNSAIGTIQAKAAGMPPPATLDLGYPVVVIAFAGALSSVSNISSLTDAIFLPPLFFAPAS